MKVDSNLDKLSSTTKHGLLTGYWKENMKFKNIPNILSISRFVLTIVLIILMGINFSYNPIIGNTNFTMIDLVCCIIFIVASFTDFLDGKIARKYHLVSNFGKFIDPLADKALVNSSLILLACYKSQYSFFLGIVVALMILRDIAVDGLRFIAASKGEVIAANIYGKLKTVAQMLAIPFLFLNGFPLNYLTIEYAYILPEVLICLALVFSYISGFIYIYRGRKFILN